MLSIGMGYISITASFVRFSFERETVARWPEVKEEFRKIRSFVSLAWALQLVIMIIGGGTPLFGEFGERKTTVLRRRA